jgi:hypothetical protein
MSLTQGDEVPHVLTRKSRLQPAEFLITSAKRLLQQNLPGAAESNCSKAAPYSITSTAATPLRSPTISATNAAYYSMR